jgi:hypothetical protein
MYNGPNFNRPLEKFFPALFRIDVDKVDALNTAFTIRAATIKHACCTNNQTIALPLAPGFSAYLDHSDVASFA